jgi:hypothetical protein
VSLPIDTLPSIETLELVLKKLLNDKELPKRAAPRIEILEPKLPFDRKLIDDPQVMPPITESLRTDPSAQNPVTDNPDPILANERRENTDPICV